MRFKNTITFLFIITILCMFVSGCSINLENKEVETAVKLAIVKPGEDTGSLVVKDMKKLDFPVEYKRYGVEQAWCVSYVKPDQTAGAAIVFKDPNTLLGSSYESLKGYHVQDGIVKDNNCNNVSTFTFDPKHIVPYSFHLTSLSVTPSPEYFPKIVIPECEQIAKKYKNDNGVTYACIVGLPDEGIYENNDVSVRFDPDGNEVQILVPSSSYSDAELDFSLNLWQEWTNTLYENTYDKNAFGFESVNKASVGDAFVPGLSCGNTSGKFEILEITWTPKNSYEDKDVQKLALNFEQTCDSGKIYRGYIRLNSNVSP